MRHVEIARRTLTGDLRDVMLRLLRDTFGYKAFRDLNESEQRIALFELEATIQAGVKRALEIMAAAGFTAIEASVEGIAIKKGVKLALETDHADLHEVAELSGKRVLVVPVSLEEFQGEQKPAEIIPDQPEMDLGPPEGEEPQEPDYGAIADQLEATAEEQEEKRQAEKDRAAAAPSEDELIGQWMAEACELDPEAATLLSTLHYSLAAWLEAHVQPAIGNKRLAAALERMGCVKHRTKAGMGINGVRLRNTVAMPEAA